MPVKTRLRFGPGAGQRKPAAIQTEALTPILLETLQESPSDKDNPTWQKVQLARNPQRPHALDYFAALCPDFVELHGDRRFGDDGAMVGGLAEFEGRTVMLLGQQKGRDTKENIARNFGMPTPEGYRKALRLMQQAEKFGLPVLCFIDTPGAYPGLESEERSVAQAIAENLLVLSQLRVPVISLVIGEGGSGGALAIGLADRLLMLENAVYSVASPEASASILWRDAAKAPVAAASMRITAQDLYGFGIIDEIIPEPAGGAHTDPTTTIAAVRESLLRHLTDLETALDQPDQSLAIEAMLMARYQKFRAIGVWEEGV